MGNAPFDKGIAQRRIGPGADHAVQNLAAADDVTRPRPLAMTTWG